MMKRSKKIFQSFLTLLLITLVIIILVPERKSEVKSKHFTLRYSKSIDSAKIGVLANALESNFFRIGTDLKTTPADNIKVNIYAHRWRYIMATKNWGGSGNIEGIAKLHFVEQAWGEKDGSKVAVHEFAHTVTLKLLLDHEPTPVDSKKFDKKFMSFPTWLWEAVSIYEANQFVDPKTLPYLDNGRYPTIEELNSRLKGGKIYDCGFTIIEYILVRYGRENLVKLIENYGDLNKVLRVTAEAFFKDWHEFVSAKYLR